METKTLKDLSLEQLEEVVYISNDWTINWKVARSMLRIKFNLCEEAIQALVSEEDFF